MIGLSGVRVAWVVRMASVAGALALCSAAWCEPVVTNAVLSSAEVGRYETVEIKADITTSATNLNWPYDANPPPSIPAGAGVSVDGLFSYDNWATTITVPGFYFQDYERRLVSGTGTKFTDERLTLVGLPGWRVRFAPTRTGDWRCRIRVTDSSGTATYPAGDTDLGFKCVPSSNHGFVSVSATDPRFFQLSDGTTLSGPGINAQIHTTYEADSLCATYGANGVKIVRWWMDFRGWQNPFGGGSANPQWSFSLTMVSGGGAKAQDRYCGLLASGVDTKQNVYLTGGLLYRLKGYIKTTDVTGAAGTGAIAYIGSTTAGFQSSTARRGTADWAAFSIDWAPSASGSYLVGCKNTGSGGTAHFDDFSLTSSADGGLTWSGEYLSKGDFDFQNYVDQPEAWKVDHVFATAKQNGVYLKAVLAEKQDYTLGCIGADGATMARSDGNFYASENHPSRWLQKAWWRYCAARWGCFTSLHSWELCNEGDPFSQGHYGAANALADYMHSVDPNKAMCTTSFWHSIPMGFWKTSRCDYIDVHEYVGPSTPGTASHGPRFYAWSDPMQAATYDTPIPFDTQWETIDFDTSTRHSGGRSVRITTKPGAGNVGCSDGYPEYHIGVDPSHTYTMRYWVKASDVGNNGGSLAWTRPGAKIAWSKVYHENDYIDGTSAYADLGTYDWRRVELTGIQPPADANTANITVNCTNKLVGSGTLWIDDVEFIDESSGRNLYVDGGFEYERIDYDAALALRKYAVLLDSCSSRIGKPAMWAETGIRGPNAYGTPYKGYDYTEENQQLVDDADGVHLRKMVWAHMGPGNPNMLSWWTDNLVKKGLWRYHRAFQSFMQGIPVSNGHYVDAAAVASDPHLRVLGQKDLTNNAAHIWIDNSGYTWKNVVDGVVIPAVSGTVTLTGFKDGAYRVEWWNTSTGQIERTQEVTCVGGSIVLSVENLASDIGCKVFVPPPVVGLQILVPSDRVQPGQTVPVTLQFTNTGGSAAKSFVVTARVPAEMDYVPGSGEATGGVYNPQDKSIAWTVDSLGAGQTGSRVFEATVR